jgi:hypothetical protein
VAIGPVPAKQDRASWWWDLTVMPATQRAPHIHLGTKGSATTLVRSTVKLEPGR